MNIKYAVLHNAIHVPASGSMGPTLDPAGAGSKIDSMAFVDGMLSVKTKDLVGKATTILVPFTSVSHMIPSNK